MAKISAVNVDGLRIGYAESRPPSNTTSTTYQVKLTSPTYIINKTPDRQFTFGFQIASSATSASIFVRVIKSLNNVETLLYEEEFESAPSFSGAYQDVQSELVETFSEGDQVFYRMEYRKGAGPGGATVSIKEVNMKIEKVHLES